MEILSLESGRATWLFPTEEFAPLGGTDEMAIIQAVVDRYKFTTYPEKPNREEISKSGLKFQTGAFEFEGKRSGIAEFGFYSDGLVALSNTTEHSNAFLEDIIEFAKANFDFRSPRSEIKKVFVSTVIVEFEKSIAHLLTQHAALLSLVGDYLNAPQKTSHDIEVMRLDLALDDSTVASSGRPRLILEARGTVPLGRKRYYSNAAIHTNSHIQMLTRIEGMFTGPLTSEPSRPS
jgi:hypothetical protein